MPQHFIGYGTTFYGKRDFREDGSFITTEWIIISWLPIYPRRSTRLISLGMGDVSFTTSYSFKYRVVEELDVCKRQVISVYAYAVSCLITFILVVQSNNFFVIYSSMLALTGLPFLMRWRARRKARKQESVSPP